MWVNEWDWLLTSGWILFSWLYPLSLTLPERVDVTIRRLVVSAGVATVPNSRADGAGFDLADVVEDLHARARGSALRVGALLGVAMALGWWLAKGPEVLRYGLVILPQIGGAFLGGMFIGRAVVYGGLGRRLAARGLHLRSQPGHLDGAAGLRPVGELFIFAASLIAALALYLGVWWLVFPHLGRYLDWRRSYAGFFAIAVLAEVLSFFVPLLWFHTEMGRRKRELLAAADDFAREVLALQGRWLTAAEDEERAALSARIDYLTARYREVQQMPTWPVDTRVRRRFAVNNLVVLTPVVLQALGISDAWSQFWSSIANAIGGSG
jgi:hypothetical protein